MDYIKLIQTDFNSWREEYCDIHAVLEVESYGIDGSAKVRSTKGDNGIMYVSPNLFYRVDNAVIQVGGE